MEFEELQSRLRELGVEVPDGTVRRWATIKLITVPVPYSKPGQRGQFQDWPEESVEDAAAVWALKHLDTYLGASPNHDTIRRVRRVAREMYDHPDSIFRSREDMTPKGEKKDFIHSYDLDPLIELWIGAIAKAQNKVPVSEPRKVIFRWVTFLGEEKRTFRDVYFEKSDAHKLSFKDSYVSLNPQDQFRKAVRKISELSLDHNESILNVINDAARACKGVIPADQWKEPYMSVEELASEIQAGVRFYGWIEDGVLLGIAGIQHVDDVDEDVDLIQHCYVCTDHQRRGIGGALLELLLYLAQASWVLVRTWEDATWAVRFYESCGFELASSEWKDQLLKKYWNIPDRQIETSVVLGAQSHAHDVVSWKP